VDAPPWARHGDRGWSLAIRVQPGARRTEVSGPYGDALRIRVAAPASDGKANAELVRFVADRRGVPRSAVSIVRGHSSRDKTLLVEPPELDFDRLTPR
jgi:uncharacterized protein